ncbi:Dynein-like protein [Phytophthora cinnamomi]|uniref:Dynein-like protein n=1 Tax=Phytophthora cinnamomi TaxID=4785 RepID=UPI003559DE65|nr:Dynein-like protein [Phytophthora cinnamomi]
MVKQQEMPSIRESEDGMLSSGDGVATEGEEEEEEEVYPMRDLMAKGEGQQDTQQSIAEDAAEGGEPLTTYVAKCYGHLETLRKRKREQEEQVETLVEETFGQIEAVMQEIMRGLQERHAVSRAQFEATDSKLTRSLRAHNRMEKKLKMIAAILLREDEGLE